MTESHAVSNWRRAPAWAAVSAYWLVSVLASEIQSLAGFGEGDGVRVISVAFFLVIAICMMTQRTGWPLWKRVAFLPATFAAHVILTVPSASALGVLMRSADHVRTVGEQWAVFLLASIPILVYSMRQSYLFVRTATASSSGWDA